MRFSFVSIVFIFSVLSCTNVQYDPQPFKRRNTNQVNRDTSNKEDVDINTDQLTLEDVEDLDLNDLRKEVDYKSDKSCADYESGVPQFHLISDALGKKFNPIRAAKNCFAKAIDDTLKPICDYEKNLDKLAKQHRRNDQALDQISRAKANVENIKYAAVDDLLELADSLDDAYTKEMDKLLDKNEGIIGDILAFAGDTEIGSFVDFLYNKTDLICADLIDFDKVR